MNPETMCIDAASTPCQYQPPQPNSATTYAATAIRNALHIRHDPQFRTIRTARAILAMPLPTRAATAVYTPLCQLVHDATAAVRIAQLLGKR